MNFPRFRFRQALSWLHRWLGLVSGVLVILISLSGAVYVFEEEIFHAVHHDLFEVAPTAGERRTVAELLPMAQAALGPDHRVDWFVAPTDPEDSWSFRSRKSNDTSLTYFGELEHDLEVFVDPWTGTVIGVLDRRLEFFQIVKMFHWSLLLRTDIGQPIVGTAVAVFVVLLISGLWLWRPRTWAQAGAKLVPKFRGPFFNRLWSWHATLGAWTFPVALVIAVTGLVWAFETVMMVVYVVASLSVAQPDRSRPQSGPASGRRLEQVLDIVHREIVARHPQATSIWFFLPREDTGSAPLDTYVRFSESVYWNSADESWDRHSGALLKSRRFRDGSRGERLVAMNYDIHVGSVLGMPGKFIAFFASLVCASLPVTGLLMWRRRRRSEASRGRIREELRSLTGCSTNSGP